MLNVCRWEQFNWSMISSVQIANYIKVWWREFAWSTWCICKLVGLETVKSTEFHKLLGCFLLHILYLHCAMFCLPASVYITEIRYCMEQCSEIVVGVICSSDVLILADQRLVEKISKASYNIKDSHSMLLIEANIVVELVSPSVYYIYEKIIYLPWPMPPILILLWTLLQFEFGSQPVSEVE